MWMMPEDPISIVEVYELKPTHLKFIVNFFGKTITTTVTSNPSVVKRWIRSTWYFRRFYRHKLVVGLGVQGCPSFVPHANEPAGTLQLCVGRHCLIFQLAHADYVPEELRLFLADPSATFVGIRNNQDAKRLYDSKHELLVRNLPLDLRYYVAREMGSRELEKASMETLVEAFLGFGGVTKDRMIGRSEWDAYELTYEQVQYACVDAHVSFEIGKKLRAWEYEKEISPYF